ncbi:diacylglycerol/lipid kinase family protein [Pseudoduganella umbonata]|uniref:Diacylglycerol kinase family enzyme n=1 Tax=Pseudoduganella umbonata TaxID=864828 RepID=A0A4P8HYK4_9BURK|nr:diacylglycerol kinase family protein [Pseudoduganella umbonata]MBB3224075.1 diacylglycerol kinase family enzyme [Pseudoduganella umbonata]QCP14058.1 diacylglycerol kinase family lipid kinase [Pseudoduganella umbonata]
MTQAAVIVNAAAGQGHDGGQATALRDKFAAVGVDADVTLAGNGEEMIGVAREALEDGIGLVVAGGGDGTMNAVASVLAGSPARFGVLPLGTLNHFAKDLGIPLALDDAIATVAHGRPVAVDVGEVNGRIFLNNSSLGLYPDIVRDREKQQRRLGRGKWLAFCWASLAALHRYPFLSLRLHVHGEEHARRTPFVFIGNNAYTMQGLSIGERTRLDGGHLSLYVAQRPTRFGLARLACHALVGRLAEARDFDVLLADELTIDTRRRMVRVATDGEVTLMVPPLDYRSRPGALTVMVPS